VGETSRLRHGRIGCEPCASLPSREEGQALVEFALIAPLFLLLVAGIIQFGVALNYWLDMQRIANQGARWAVVNSYPGCPRSGPDAPCSPTLQEYLASAPVSGGLAPTVQICFEEQNGSPSGAAVGDPVTVRLTSQFDFVPIVQIGQLELRGVATMRVEQPPTRYTATGC
jgi:hypothetical protein